MTTPEIHPDMYVFAKAREIATREVEGRSESPDTCSATWIAQTASPGASPLKTSSDFQDHSRGAKSHKVFDDLGNALSNCLGAGGVPSSTREMLVSLTNAVKHPIKLTKPSLGVECCPPDTARGWRVR